MYYAVSPSFLENSAVAFYCVGNAILRGNRPAGLYGERLSHHQKQFYIHNIISRLYLLSSIHCNEQHLYKASIIANSSHEPDT